ncbi:MAG: helix-turn-helix transcriptional regulator [Treponema sp.]|jgi:DNA-binding CsgD family transcriptional regulator|nr:helix-turn-helix transcriptional regulator [Treponema sp.]
MTFPVVLFLQVLRGIEVIGGWFIIFFMLYRPPSLARKVILLVSFPVFYTFWYLIPIDVWFAPDTALGKIVSDDIVNEILWIAIILSFAFLCGSLRGSLFSAAWYIGIEQTIDVMRAFINRLMNDGAYIFNYPQFNVQYLLILIWAFSYYWIRRKFTGMPSLVFQILIILTPIGATVLMTRYSDTVRHISPNSSMVFPLYVEGLLIGVFILAINFITFYLYIKLHTAYKVKTFAMQVADTPPVWSPENGLSELFVIKYHLTGRERQIIDCLLTGKSYQEMAETLYVSSKTIETHLRHIYEKTCTKNRFELYTLIKG